MGEIGHNGHLPVHILVVEDSAVQAEALRRMLAKEGYTVSVAKNGIEGLSITREKRPDLVITDIMMPEMNGFELCGHIKTEEKFKATPVILLTSLNDPKDVINGLKCGADNFITKPFDEKYLLSRVKYMLLSKELHIRDRTQMGVEIYFAGEKHLITSERQQILDILLSTYETAVQKNFELVKAQENLKRLNEQLEEKVKERTIALEAEVAERKRAQKRLQHLNMVLFAIRKVNQLITRESNCNRLLQGACERMVSTRGYDSAWIVLLNESKKVVSYAEAGIGEDFLPLEEQLKYSKLPICSRKALTQSGSVITQDTTASCADCPLAHWHTPRGELTSRVEHGGHIYGLVTVSGPASMVTDKEEIELFEEVTADIALGLSNIKREEQRKKAEEVLRKNEERFRLAAESATDLIYEWDMKDRVDWFGKIDELLGYAPNELPRTLEAWVNSIHPDDRSRVEAAVKNHLEKNEPYDIEYRIRRKDGAYNYWWARGTAVRDDKGNPYRWIGAVSDVTERKRAEQSLRASENKFRTLVQNIPQKIFLKDKNSIYISCNENYAQDLKIKADEITGKTDYEFYSKELAEKYRVDDKRIMEFGKIEELEEKYIQEGQERWVNTLKVPVKDEHDNVIGIFGIFWDVTERKRAEEELQKSEEKFRLIANTITEVFWLADARIQKMIYVSPGYERVWGRTCENLYENPRSFIDAICPEDRERVLADLEVQKSGQPFGHEYRITWPDGSIRWIWDRGFPVLDKLGKAPLYVGIAQDITERKQAEEELRQSELRFKELFDEAPVGYFECDAQGRITRINRTELEMLGYTLEEMLSQPAWKFVVEEEIAHQQILSILAGTVPSVRGIERTYRRKNGTTFSVLIEDRLLRDEKGSIKGIRAIIQDITERKKAEEALHQTEEQLRQSQKMEAIGRLAGGIAHDFNNLLTVIKGYSQLSLLNLEPSHPLRTNLENVQSAADRASDLTRQLLAFSRRQVLEMKVVNLNAVLKNLDKMLHRVIGEDVELVNLLAEDLGRVKADIGQIEQVIMNLAVNARDAMPNGGKLTIETANVELDEKYARTHIAVTPGPYVMISVSDTGVGMTPEVKEQVFEPFFTTKEKGKGTGLGLSTVYGIVKQSGGNIWVYSELGKGTSFKIYLPRVDEPLEEKKEKVMEEGFPRGDETILIVEDEEEVKDLTAQILKKYGYTILKASKGNEAISICDGHKGSIHLMLTDVVMPEMDGRRLAESIISLRPGIKVLYMSGYTDNAIIHHGVLDKGMNYIQKPFTVESLARKVREVLDK
jgi:two-component system cell cycle sensor histidine kinase/response regulator CckA